MNRIYLTLWSVAKQSWQAVPETAKTADKKSKSSAGGVLASVALSFSLTGAANAQAPPATNQLPTGGTVVRGSATIQQTATAQAAAMTVNQTSQRAVVNWNTFNIGSAASVNFVQPNAQAVTLNRVNDSNPIQIFGRMTSNGQVVLTNANGIYFAPGSSVDVGAITATTHSISNDNFMSGNYVFERNGATRKVVNEGRITAALAGYVALLAPEVQNAGVVVARAGTVAMAAGETITLNIDGAGSLAGITTTPSAIATLIENKQAVQAPDGQIILSAVALNKLQAGVIKNSGSLEANSLVSKGGKIYLEGDDITLSNTSKLEAKGALGGGTVLVGGDWQGSGDLRQATKVTMAAGATIDASATDNGDGGKVVLWSDVHNADSVTRVNGSIKAEAGPNGGDGGDGGDGGKVETSGHYLNVNGIQVSTQAYTGIAGDWLLDPYNITINTSNSGTPFSDTNPGDDSYTTAATSVIKAGDINLALANGNVTLSTGPVGLPGTDAGSITISSALTWATDKTLTLTAAAGVTGSSSISMTGGGRLIFNQAGTSTYSGVISGTGGRVVKDGAGVLTLSGANTYTGTTIITNGTLKAGIASVADTSGAFGKNSAVTLENTAGATIDISGYSTQIGSLSGGGANGGNLLSANGKVLTVGADGIDTTFSGNFSSGGGLTKIGTGALTISGSAPYVENFIVNNGILKLGSSTVANYAVSGGIGTVVTVNNGGTFDLNGYNGVIVADGGMLNLNGPGYNNLGALINGAAGTTSSITPRYWNWGTNPSISAIGKLVIGTYYECNGVTAGACAQPTVNVNAPGILDVSGMTVVSLKNPNGSPNYNVTAGTLRTNANNSNANINTVNLSANATYNLATSASFDYNKLITGAGGLTIDGTYPFQLTLKGLNTYSGPTAINSGQVIAGVATTDRMNGPLGVDSAVTIANTAGAQLTLLAYTRIGSLNGGGSSGGSVNLYGKTLTVGANDTDSTFSGIIADSYTPTGTGTLNKIGTGTLTLSGTNTYAGLTSIGNGTLVAASNAALGTTGGGVTVASGATLGIGGPASPSGLTIGAEALAVADGGAIHNMAGWNGYAGVMTLSGNATITIDSGTKLNFSATGAPAITVAADKHLTLYTNGNLTFGKALVGGNSNSSYVQVGSGTLVSGLGSTLAETIGVYARLYDPTGTDYSSEYGSAPDYTVALYNAASGGTKLNLMAGTDYSGTVAWTGTLPTASSNATSYALTYASGLNVSNARYVLLGPANATTWTVTPKPVTVSLTAPTTTYTYDGITSYSTIASGLTAFTSTAMVGSESIASINTSVSGTGVAQAGNFTVIPSIVSLGAGTLANNYSFTPTPLTVAVAKANLSKVTAAKVYDGLSSVSSAQVIAIEGVNGETFSASFGTAVISNKNYLEPNKTLTDLSGLTLSSTNGGLRNNYNLGTGLPVAGSNNEVTISQRALTLAAVTDSKAYDGSTSSSSTVTVTNKASTDTVSAAQSFTSKDVAGAGQSTLQVNTGYTIVDGGSADMSSNYVVATQTAAGTISKANLNEVTASKVYDGLSTVTAAQVTAIEGVNGETFTASAGTATISNKNVVASNKTLTDLSGLSLVGGNNTMLASNYNLSTGLPTFGSNNQVTINAADLTKVAASKVYDGLSTVTAAQVTAIEGVNNETFTASAGTATISNKNVAVSSKTLTDLSGLTLVGGNNTMLASNYNLSTGLPVAGTGNEVSISQRALSLIATTDTKTYDGFASSSGTVTVSNKASIDTVTATQSFASKDAAGAGQSQLQVNMGFTIVDGASADMSSNYMVTRSAATGTINKANLSKVTATKVYDGLNTVTATQVTAIEGVNGETFTALAGTAAISDKNVSTLNKTLTGLNSLTLVGGSNTMLVSNYNLNTGLPVAGTNNQVTISQRALTLSAASETKTYDASTYSSGVVTVGNNASTDTVTATQSFTSKDAAGAGLSPLHVNAGYTIVDGTNVDMSGNYVVATQTATGTINKANLSKVTAAKYYDSLNTVTAAQITAIEGVNNETFTTSAGTAAINDKNVTTANKTFTDLRGLTLSSANGGLRGNYNLDMGLPVAGNSNQVTINAIDLQVTGVSAANKLYDATRNATLTGVATVAGISGDDVSATGTGLGWFANKNVGTARTVTVTGYALAGTDAGNYNVLQPVGVSSDITQAPLSISGITAQNKVYDGGTSATVSTSNVVKVGLFGNDVVNVVATGSFVTKTAGNGKPVTLSSSYSGADTGNYLITDQTSTMADITAKALGLSIPGASRVYDGTTVISPSGPVTLSGIVGVDQVNLGLGNVTGYVDKNVGSNKTVTYAGLALSGSDAGNYTLPVNPTSNASITPAALSISGITAADKIYDAGTTTTVNTSNIVRTGLIGNDVVNMTTTGSFIDKNVGIGKTVNLSSSYSGADAGNYNITDQATATADISKAPLTVTAANAVRNFGDANPALSVVLTGFVGGETIATSGVTGAGLASTTATTSTDAGAAVITAAVGTLTASNYAFTQFVDGTLTIRPISALNNTEVSTLIGAQLANLSGAQVGSFSASQLQVFSPQQLNALSPSQLAGMTTLQLLSLSPAQMAAISPAKIASMTAAELGAFTDAQLQALSPTQLAAIAPTNFAAFTPAQIMAMSIAQVQNLSPEQLATFSPAQIASLSAAELAYFDARQLAAIGIFPKADSQSTFEAPIPVMTEVATANLSVAAASISASEQTASLSPRAVQALLFPNTESTARTGILAITILNSAQAKPTTAGIAFEQDADTVSLRDTSAPASVPPMSDKLVFNDKLVTFMVATPTGEMVAFEGSVLNNRMVIVAPSPAAKRVARSEMRLVLAAAVTSLGKENRVMLASLTGVVLDLR